MSEIRLAKFETLIEDIDKTIRKQGLVNANNQYYRISDGVQSGPNMELCLIFDYNVCNEYAKIIIDRSELRISPFEGASVDQWSQDYPDIVSLSDVKTKIDAAKSLVKYCRESRNRSEGYKFIFWSLMILTVDKNNAQEYLSLICDFAKMLRITNEEFEDIIYAIKCVYHEGNGEYLFKSESIPRVLGGIFNLYGGHDLDIDEDGQLFM